MKNKMKLVFGSYSGTYKQMRYLEEQNLTNALTETKFSLVCFGSKCQNSLSSSTTCQNSLSYSTARQNINLQNYGPMIGHINFTEENLKEYTLICSNFRNYVKHMCHAYAAKVEPYAYYAAYKMILKHLNLIRWQRIQQKSEVEIDKLTPSKFLWLTHKDRLDSLNIPTFEILDLEHVLVLGTDEEILFVDFIKTYANFLISKGYNGIGNTLLNLINSNTKQDFQFIQTCIGEISEFLDEIGESNIKFNIGGPNYYKLNELVEKYSLSDKRITLSAITKSKMTYQNKIHGYLYQLYEIKNDIKDINNDLYIDNYKTVKVIEETYGILNENKLFIELFNVFIPSYVIRKL